MQPCLICGRPINTRTDDHYTKANAELEQIYMCPACYCEYIEQEK